MTAACNAAASSAVTPVPPARPCPQVVLSIAAFSLFSLPVGQGIGTQFLERAVQAPPELVSIRSLDEALVIAAALSMSSSAFVLQLLAERGEMGQRFSQATLGILLFQVRGQRLGGAGRARLAGQTSRAMLGIA